MANAYRVNLVKDIKNLIKAVGNLPCVYVHRYDEEVEIMLFPNGYLDIAGLDSGKNYRIHTMSTRALHEIRTQLFAQYGKKKFAEENK